MLNTKVLISASCDALPFRARMPSSRVAVVRSMGKRTFPFKCPVANPSVLARNSGARVAKKRHRQGLTVIWCRGQCLLSKRAIPAEAPPRRRITTNSGRAICTSPGHRGDALCCGCPSWCPSISLQRRVSMELPPLSLYRRERRLLSPQRDPRLSSATGPATRALWPVTSPTPAARPCSTASSRASSQTRQEQ